MYAASAASPMQEIAAPAANPFGMKLISMSLFPFLRSKLMNPESARL